MYTIFVTVIETVICNTNEPVLFIVGFFAFEL